ncbi:MAG TPA: hypothetical protein VEV83_00960 [Parafilimonas sp.]|nr:hypothetical protein [Parafilimonas sp.]
MKRIVLIISCVAIGVFFVGISCKKSADPNLAAMTLKPAMVSGKSGHDTTAQLDIVAPYGVSKLLITKTVNLVPDTAFGTLSVMPESTGADTYHYMFSYTFRPDEVDKLVGINFHLEDSTGHVAEKDLTVNTIASGAQIIYSHKWKLISKFWATANPPAENIQDCEKDNIYSYNADGTIPTPNYGMNPCLFDGFNIYDNWTLSDDEKVFTQTYHSVFDTTKVTTEVYNVESLTSDRWVMDITLDLTAFGLSDHEKFVYTYQSE